MEIKVKISKNNIAYKDKKTGADKEMRCIAFELPNGRSFNFLSDRFNYREFDYLTDLIDGNTKI